MMSLKQERRARITGETKNQHKKQNNNINSLTVDLANKKVRFFFRKWRGKKKRGTRRKWNKMNK